MTAPVRRPPAFGMHERLGASFEVGDGWMLAQSYGDDDAELDAVRSGVAVADVTPRGKIDVRGEIDQALASAGDAFVARIAPDHAIVLTAPGDEEITLAKLEAGAGPRAMVTDATHLFAGYAVLGPGLPELLARASGWNPATLADGGATGAPVCGVRALIVRRDLGVPTLELYVATEFARYVWETLHDLAVALGGRAVGWRALRSEGWS